uniref:SAM-dependent MTase RsmB/NOP-type domain-containing protein n=1 Tax=Chromera velia CCMP2878 TaxID=1169474 RepID=A0A0G4HF55_9ALVE|mmetsp:Transcript_6287/g.12442  ORF Transcript_6287/g.12442 Transcript_6287/m.12442 type:complete len:774 (-) Transcript_6287:153-2474(-)|eukprot:Cvel_26795.t1-p1 / transcript=Cvel_26795.t1 / gene=Cvel_26795 / organism=Chromera_velia_CCMP2878 / gene_product=tRNA (cytosine(34)-C(5))-methyltransferase, putative / transcript_product=tRNA (cytosine(34)-C(5))-methyltransferase, putative / location=Cvel_scaffold3244:4106-7289(+) / protein_length=773 / sequence_SO=supercontig / SO=protein_coding / is_pseudo=false
MAPKKKAPPPKRKQGKWEKKTEPKPNVWDDRVSSTAERSNDSFESYYQKQKIVPEEEWGPFIETLQTDLPTTFRVVEGSFHSTYLIKTVEAAMAKADETKGTFRRIPWYPGGRAFELTFSRAALRSDESTKNFHTWLVKQSEAGSLFRQEAVSMIPVLFLDVKENNFVLDMCAAPGSKTSQIMESMHVDAWTKGKNAPTGVCVANDANSKRAHMMIHHVRRVYSPALVVTNHEAQHYPKVFLKKDFLSSLGIQSPSTGTDTDVEGKDVRLQFDRILCDVPCSGDGTLRKALVLWKDWTVNLGTGIHKLQWQIVQRASHLLTTGGRMVYSTCSLNPVENEAIVAALLRESKGALELVDVSGLHKDLKRRPGIKSWFVAWNEKSYTAFEEVPPSLHSKVTKTMFPPPSDEVDSLHLDRCMRFTPHDGNTGGFFVAVLHKRAPVPWEKRESEREAEKKRRAEAMGVSGVEKGEVEEGEEKEKETSSPPVKKHHPEEKEEEEMGKEKKGDEDMPELPQEDTAEQPAPAAAAAAAAGASSSSSASAAAGGGAPFRGPRVPREPKDFAPVSKFDEEFPEHAVWKKIAVPYGFSDPDNLLKRIFYRCAADHSPPAQDGPAPKRVFLVTQGAAAVMRSEARSPLIVLSGGVVAFEKTSSGEPPFRLAHGAASWLLPLFSPQSRAGTGMFAPLSAPFAAKLLCVDRDPPRLDLETDLSAEEKAQLEGIDHMRSFVAVTMAPGGNEMAMPGWKGRKNVELLVDKSSRYAVKCLLDNDTEVAIG